MNKRTAAQKRAEWERQYHSEAFVDWGRFCECCICGTRGTDYLPNHNHHVRPEGELPVGAGRKADARWIIILCPRHHDECHKGAETFAQKYGKNLADEARKHWAEGKEAGLLD